MRTTLNVDDDVLDMARAAAKRLRKPLRRVVNEALRSGLEAAASPAERKAYCTEARKLGLKQGRSLDNIGELLAQIEGDENR